MYIIGRRILGMRVASRRHRQAGWWDCGRGLIFWPVKEDEEEKEAREMTKEQ
jgi:hypothetical protein